MINSTFKWYCPNCHVPLENQQNVWRCENKHTFDIAKESYVNLLLANQKKSKEPGDSKAMINSRRQFLNKGHYQKLADALVSEVKKLNENKENVSILDAGCAEGYYLRYLCPKLSSMHKKVIAAGIDVSKHAISLAAKSSQSSPSVQYQFAVASSFNLPLQGNYVDLVLQVFAPAKPNEIKRVLKGSGYWLKVTPASKHLHELKSYVYDVPQPHKETQLSPEGFELIRENEISFTFALEEQECRMNLLAMTPFYWSISNDKKGKLLRELSKVSAHFTISIYQKCG